MAAITFNLVTGKPKKNGTVAIYLRAIKKSRKKDINLEISVEQKQWKEKFKKVASHPLEQEYNSLLFKYMKRANELVISAAEAEKDLSLEEFAQLFKKNSKPNCFYSYAERELERMKPAITAATYKNYMAAVRKFQGFRKELSLSAIDNDLLRAFEHYLRTEHNNSSNTINKSIKYIKTLLKTAIERGEAKPVSYNVKTTKTNRDYLTMMELGLLEKLSGTLPDKLQNTLDSFLFACFTGLRYSDLKLVKRSNISEESITIIQEKTNTKVFIPLCKKAIELIEKQPPERELLFKVYSNQKMNDYLTALAARAGINKNVTCHVARHTFATISLNLGIKIEALSDVLGHSDLRTTKIYAKMLEETKRKEFKKWDEQTLN